MSDWIAPAYPTPAPGEAAGWRSVGGAFAASAAIHALAIAFLAALMVREPAEPVTVRAAPEPAPARAPVPKAVPVQAPWSAEPFDRSPPPWMFSRPMISEGVVFAESRNIAVLGESIERRITESYAIEPQFPVELKPAEELGYPLDLLESGVEGRVFVWFGVDEEGKVVDREALDGPQALVDWVLERLDRIVDKPAHNGETPARGWVALEIEFSRDAARTAREMRAAGQERLDRAELRAKAREMSASP